MSSLSFGRRGNVGERKKTQDPWVAIEDGVARILAIVNNITSLDEEARQAQTTAQASANAAAAGNVSSAFLSSSLISTLTGNDLMRLNAAVFDFCTKPPRSTKNNADGATTNATTGVTFFGDKLYSRLHTMLNAHMEKQRATLAERHGVELLRDYVQRCGGIFFSARVINHIFAYLNRHWVRREADEGKHIVEVRMLVLQVWRDLVYKALSKDIVGEMLSMITKERNGESVDTALLKRLTDGLVGLGLNREFAKESTLEIYRGDFEKAFLSETEDFYTTESSHVIATSSVVDYMKRVDARLGQEIYRVQQYLHPSTETLLVQRCRDVLVTRHMSTIQAEFAALLVINEEQRDAMSLLYALLSPVPCALEPLASTFETHVRDAGYAKIEAIAKEAIATPKLYVDAVLDFYRKYDDLVTTSFQGDAKFAASLERAARRFINENAVTTMARSSSKSPELLAKYMDQLLRRGTKLDDADTERVLTGILSVFKFVDDKDVFSTMYSKLLAKRLIYASSASEEHERLVISRLRDLCGQEYVLKITRMLTDIQLSLDLQDDFKTHLEAKDGKVPTDFSTLVLSQGSWPLPPPPTTFTLPESLQACVNCFEAFYRAKFNGRKLMWLANMSKGELRTRYLPSNRAGYTLLASTYQIGVLLLFERSDALTAAEVQTGTALNDVTLRGVLETLLKTRLLNAADGDGNALSPADAEASAGDRSHVYSLNLKFKAKKLRLNINLPMKATRHEEETATAREVDIDRNHQIQACIVRVAKARKHITHQALMSEVISQLQSRFKPKVPHIKKCIDVLIEKEYLARSDAEKDSYDYLA